MRVRAARALALLLLASLLAPAGAAAAQGCPRTSLGEVEAEVRCLVCGTPLALATEAPQAERERALIRRLVDRCESKEEIKAALVDEYGEDVLSTPGTEGFDLAAWLVPILAAALGLGAVAAAAIGWRATRRSEPPAPAAEGAPTAAARRLQSDLDRYEL